MTMLEHTTAPNTEAQVAGGADRPKLTVELLADDVLGYTHLIDRVLDFTYNVLGVCDLDLRVRQGRPGYRVRYY